LVELCLASLGKKLDQTTAQLDSRPAVGVVMADPGYPDRYPKGQAISLPSDGQSDKIFHAGTALNGEQLVSSGGRVLCITALGENVTQATANAYQQLNQVEWPEAYFRKDIAYRAIARES